MIFSGTADQKNLDNKIGGSCNKTKEKGQNKLRLEIYVCTQKEIDSGNCETCATPGCYYKGKPDSFQL